MAHITRQWAVEAEFGKRMESNRRMGGGQQSPEWAHRTAVQKVYGRGD